MNFNDHHGVAKDIIRGVGDSCTYIQPPAALFARRSRRIDVGLEESIGIEQLLVGESGARPRVRRLRVRRDGIGNDGVELIIVRR